MPVDDSTFAAPRSFETRWRAWTALARFGAAALREALSPSTYNSATREVVARQIYFTGWQILPWFTAFIAVLSLVVTKILADAARNLGVYEYALQIALRAVVLDIVPLLTALFVALRTGAAMATEVALMRIRNELGTMERMGIDPMQLELVPRVIGGTVSLFALTTAGVGVSLLCAHLVVTNFEPWATHDTDLQNVVAEVVSPGAMFALWAKVVAFGLAVTLIPIAESLNAPRRMYHAPIAVLNGMVRLFFALMVIEVTVLALQYL